MAKAASTVEEFTKRVQAGEKDLHNCVERAYHFVMAESVRAGIIATCREVGLWPPNPTPASVPADDCCFQDTTSPLPIIAQRAFNDETQRTREELLKPLVRRATTASFLVDFITEAGLPAPTLSEQHHEMLQEFMSRVEEYVRPSNSSQGAESLREALLMGLAQGGLAAESARREVKLRWSKNWETPSGTLLNVAAAGLAIAAGVVALKRATKPRA